MSAGGSLVERYTRHNLARGRGFIYSGSERVRELLKAIRPTPAGPILDLGCRDASLRITPCLSRFAAVWSRMFGNDLVWSGTRR